MIVSANNRAKNVQGAQHQGRICFGQCDNHMHCFYGAFKISIVEEALRQSQPKLGQLCRVARTACQEQSGFGVLNVVGIDQQFSTTQIQRRWIWQMRLLDFGIGWQYRMSLLGTAVLKHQFSAREPNVNGGIRNIKQRNCRVTLARSFERLGQKQATTPTLIDFAERQKATGKSDGFRRPILADEL
ncbi:hypothetical protein [Shimia sp. SK013]|uniref:hypothetical protein n=1 Tax=Shimia sp. SK013 TaxID=1389006 RepID=UPI00128F5089|nr:hypothetical protein [Shimia sp. SK013]